MTYLQPQVAQFFSLYLKYIMNIQIETTHVYKDTFKSQLAPFIVDKNKINFISSEYPKCKQMKGLKLINKQGSSNTQAWQASLNIDWMVRVQLYCLLLKTKIFRVSF